MRVVWVRLAAAFGILLAWNGWAGDLNGPVSFVPWKVIVPGDPPSIAPLTLYWIPASRDDFKHSDLLFSRSLTAFASQCVAMNVIRTDDGAMIQKLGVASALPIVVLIGADGKALGKVESERGALRVTAVERLVRDQLRARESTLDGQLDDARKKALAGDRDSAVSLYKSAWDLRCVFPRKGREAQRELKKLGVVLAEALQ
ncbi:MAG: hypothetical protein DMF58_10950 [Acidobacteria bacterium]|nr:MAG: hypothetical protein DMF58_10950 [Acidobacteriota bacterium]